MTSSIFCYISCAFKNNRKTASTSSHYLSLFFSVKRYILIDYQIKNCKSQMVRLSCSTFFSYKSLNHFFFAICASLFLNKFGLANLVSLEDRNCDVTAIYGDNIGKYRKYSEILILDF